MTSDVATIIPSNGRYREHAESIDFALRMPVTRFHFADLISYAALHQTTLQPTQFDYVCLQEIFANRLKAIRFDATLNALTGLEIIPAKGN